MPQNCKSSQSAAFLAVRVVAPAWYRAIELQSSNYSESPLADSTTKAVGRTPTISTMDDLHGATARNIGIAAQIARFRSSPPQSRLERCDGPSRLDSCYARAYTQPKNHFSTAVTTQYVSVVIQSLQGGSNTSSASSEHRYWWHERENSERSHSCQTAKACSAIGPEQQPTATNEHTKGCNWYPCPDYRTAYSNAIDSSGFR